MIRQLATESFDAKRSWGAVVRESKIGFGTGVVMALLAYLGVLLLSGNNLLAFVMGFSLLLDMFLGAIAGGASDAQFDAACQFAAGLGIAFKIRDDMLDVIGTKEEMGKGVGTDEIKNTFVRLYGLEKCEELVRKYTDYAINALDAFDDTAYLKSLAMSLTTRRT
jgi:hypothetical protein